MVYYTADGASVCPKCANGDEFRTWDADNLEFFIVAAAANYENTELFCAACGERIPSAYADDDLG